MFPRSILAAVVLAAVGGSVNAAASCARNYTVVSGDTCDTISAKQNVSSYQLATVNNGTIDAGCDNLFVGEPLCLGIVGQDCNVTHVIKVGETCLSIAAAAKTTFRILLANNPNVHSDCSNIYYGEVCGHGLDPWAEIGTEFDPTFCSSIQVLCTADKIIVVNSTLH